MRRTHVLMTALILSTAAPVWADAPVKAAANGESLKFTARTRKGAPVQSGQFEVVEKAVEWAPAETALIVCDMWDTHWCRSASRRTGEIAPRIDALAKAVRARGGLVIHAPSDTMKFYADTPQRKRAIEAPRAEPPSPGNRLGGPPLPIDDTDNGCDDQPQCTIPNGRTIPYPWKRQHAAIEIAEPDAISDNGQEVYNLLKARGIKHLLVCGVHTNMCILHRTFAIKQMTRWGVDVALVRDLTDAMYNPRKAPYVSHDRGTALVIEHIETHWCPSTLSADLTGDPPAPRVLVVTGEHEYDSKNTLPAFAKEELEQKLGFKCTFVNSDDPKSIPNTGALDDADVLVLYLRRRTLPEDQLNKFKAWFAEGKPVVAVRTSSHAFQTWLEFDDEVLGCNYTGHHGKDSTVQVRAEPNGAGHPILRGVSPVEFASKGSLYKSSPLAKTATPLLTGTWQDKPAEPVAWTNTYKGGRVFYTSLGHAEDFKTPQFRTLLRNAILWAADKPVGDSKDAG
jgi:type 1 glutamine amidotransferase/nicotinamidase-related amidase